MLAAKLKCKKNIRKLAQNDHIGKRFAHNKIRQNIKKLLAGKSVSYNNTAQIKRRTVGK